VKTREQIKSESIMVYFAIKETMKNMNTNFCQSWWINMKNFDLSTPLSIKTINQRAKLLIRDGYLIIDKSKTSTSTGTCYKLTDKSMAKQTITEPTCPECGSTRVLDWPDKFQCRRCEHVWGR